MNSEPNPIEGNRSVWQSLQSRRALLKRAACGFGSLALAGINNRSTAGNSSPQNPLAALPSYIPARAKRIIFLFMQGGPSHVDSFDFKPHLEASHMKEVDIMGYRFNNFRKATKQVMMMS